MIQNTEILDGQRMKQVEESGYKYLGITQKNEIKALVMNNKIRTEHLRTVRKFAKTELYARNVLMGINK